MPENSAPKSNITPPKALIAAIEKLLRPLVRLLLSFQITYPQLADLLKRIYVDVASNEFEVEGKRQSDSRVTLLTGVHRKDVKRLREAESSALELTITVSAGAQIIGHWLAADEYTNSRGKPLPLPLKPTDDSNVCFESLVEQVLKQDIRPRVILDEWTNLGIAHIDKDSNVVLNSGAFTPDKGLDEKAYFFGKNLQDHINAGAHNLLGRDPSYFDRSVYYDKLSSESVKELAELAEQIGMQALTEMNKHAATRQKRDRNKKGEKLRMNFGIFNFNNLKAADDNANDE
jgi:hypothetical protein